MFDICIDHPDRHVLASTPTLQQAFEAIEALEDLTAAQLARSGEGATDFWLHHIIQEGGCLVAFAATKIHPAALR